MTPFQLRVLHVEDSEVDAALVLRALKRFGFEVTSQCVDRLEDFRSALEQQWDVVICDYRLAGFSAPDVLAILHESGKDLPFIVVSGTIGEDVAVQMMLAGAHDYLMKDNLARLGPAVTREIRDVVGRSARRKADADLRESERRLKLALSAAQMGVWTFNLKDGSVFWSDRCYEITGLADFDKQAESFFNLVHPEDAGAVRAGVDRAIETRGIFAHEFRIVRSDGSVAWLSNVAQVDFDADNQPLLLVGMVEDITERKAAGDELQRQRSMTKAVLDSALDAVIVIDAAGHVVLWNPAAERMFGRSSKDVLGQRLDLLIIPTRNIEAFQRILDHLHRDDAAGLPGATVSERAIRSDGVEFPIEFSIAPVHLSGSFYAVGVIRDISQREQVMQALQESDERWQFALEGSGDGVFDWRADTNRTYWSPRAKAMLGYAYDAAGENGNEWEMIVHADDKARVDDEISSHLAGKAPAYSSEHRVRCKDGDYKWILGRGKVVKRDGRGHALRMIGTYSDITDRKNAEAEREKLYAKFLHSQKMESVGRLAGGIAHDFNNHLTVINGYSSLLLRGLPQGHPMRDALEQVSSSGERAAALVRQLLAFSRKDKPERTLLNVNELVLSMEKSLLRLVGEDIRVITLLQSSLDQILADRHHLEQVLMNLVVNGRDAMPDGGVLYIETERQWLDGTCAHCGSPVAPGYYIGITVRDTGTGIEESVRERLFEPFFTTKDVGKGTGLGLSVVEGVVVENGGHLKVDSTVGKGTSFHIYFPVATGVVESKTAPSDYELHNSGTILLVEDELEVRRLMTEVLEGYGHHVVPAASGAEALSRLESTRFDLLITDVKMPVMSGLELAARVAREWPQTRLLFVSGYSDETLGVPGDAMILRKPLDLDQFSTRVRELLRKERTGGLVLVVDDEPAIRRFIRAALEQAGYRVSEASDGLDALRQLQAYTPDIVITDLVMPGKEGIETIEVIRRDYPGIRIIAMSGVAGGQYLAMAKILGASTVLLKPISVERLLAAVSSK